MCISEKPSAISSQLHTIIVMRGLVPRIHDLNVDGRDKPGHDMKIES
jgi:hypothetical protein